MPTFLMGRFPGNPYLCRGMDSRGKIWSRKGSHMNNMPTIGNRNTSAGEHFDLE
jgi:hypothetical protein